MSDHFRPLDRDTLFLFPPSVQEWLPADHLARFIGEIVSKLDLGPLRAKYAGRGSEAYQPEMMVALLFYGYATGIFSSRKLERATFDSVAFRYIAANQHPEHDTIATFRRRFLPEVKACFKQILCFGRQAPVIIALKNCGPLLVAKPANSNLAVTLACRSPAVRDVRSALFD